MKRMLAFLLAVIMFTLPTLVSCGESASTEESGHTSTEESREVITHTLTFKDADGTVIGTHLAEHNAKIHFPEEPTKEGYQFCGWSLDSAGAETIDSSVSVTEDMVLYASWVEEGYYLYSYVITYNGAASLYVTPDSSEDLKIVARLIEEDIFFSPEYPNNKKYVEGENATFSWEKGQSELYENGLIDFPYEPIEVSLDVLKGRVIETSFVDDAGNIVGIPYTDTNFTTRNEEFLAVTVNDFSENDTVLNFDKKDNENFGVLADDVKVLSAESVSTNLDDNLSTPVYTVKSPSEELAVGDKVFINSPDCKLGILCMIKEFTKDGETYTVIPVTVNKNDTTYGLDDFYKFLKVDMHSSYEVVTENGTTEQALMQREIVFEDEDTAGSSITLAPISFSTDNIEIFGGATGYVHLYTRYKYAPKIFSESYFEAEVNITSSLEGKLSAMVKKESESADSESLILKLGKLTFPMSVTGFFAYGDLDFSVSWELKGGVEATWSAEIQTGVTYTSLAKKAIPYRNSNINGTVVECKGEAQIRLGPQPSIGVQFLNGVANAKLEGFYGIEISGELIKGDGNVHKCDLCFDGEVKKVAEITAKLEFNLGWTYTPLDITLIRLEDTITDFYASLIVDGQVVNQVGLGDCNNINTLRRFLIYIKAPADKWKYIRDIHVGNNWGLLDDTITYEKEYILDGTYEFDGTLKIDIAFETGWGQLQFELADEPVVDSDGVVIEQYVEHFQPTFQIGIYKEQSTLVAWEAKFPDGYYIVPGHKHGRSDITWTEEDEKVNWDAAQIYSEDGVTVLLIPVD